ncbi:MAG: very short patch repair endonuclease [Bacteroidales bacterium]|nr:very short patch repair endonuclease [Bacteroidales bacterium]
MSDRLSPEQRHRCMSHIRSRNTQPELKVRRWLWNHGYRYRLCVKSVPGSPDIVMRKYRTAIFVNGCFWHGHGVKLKIENGKLKNGEGIPSSVVGNVQQDGRDARRASETGNLNVENSPCCKIPNTNRDFWVNKIRRNQQRDQQNYKDLQDNGWQVLVVWECQLAPKKLEQTMLQVEILLNENLLATLHPKRLRYDQPDEAPLPVAAEPEVEYRPRTPKVSR